MIYKPVVDIFTDIMTAVQAAYDLVDSEEPYFMYGHPLEIVNILSEKTEDNEWKFKKFPLVALFQDFTEEVKVSERKVRLNLAIITDTKPDYYAVQRYTNTFKTILYPILDLLQKYILASNYIGNINLTYNKTDRLYWGKQGLYGNEGNIFNDYVDAIEIDNLELEINEIC